MVGIKQEKIIDIKDELVPMLELHWSEVAINQDKVKLNVDWERYFTLEELGFINIVTVRVDGVLVGYCVNMMDMHLHYKDHMYAINDVFFIHPDHRGSTLGIRLFKATEAILKAQGVSVWMVHTKTHTSAASFLVRLGFEHDEEVYSKFIGGQ